MGTDFEQKLAAGFTRRKKFCNRLEGAEKIRFFGNREFTSNGDGWYHIIPKGEYFHPEAKKKQILDGVALNNIKATFDREAARPNFPGILVDFEHHSYEPDKRSTAAGWLVAMDLRENGLWGKIRWSGEGLKAVNNGSYRLLSPTWLPRDVQMIGSDSLRPTRLDSIGLTNTPNMRGMVPLSNRDTTETQQNKQQDETMSNRAIKSNDPYEVEMTHLDARNLDEQQKANELHRLASAYKNRTGALWEDAWAMVCSHNPGLVDKTVKLHRGPVPDYEAEELSRLATAYKNRNGCSFADAWNAVCIERPDLAKHVVLGNRGARPQDASMALPEEVEAQDRLVQIFIDRLTELHAKLGSYAAAFAQIKETQPSVIVGFNTVIGR